VYVILSYFSRCLDDISSFVIALMCFDYIQLVPLFSIVYSPMLLAYHLDLSNILILLLIEFVCDKIN